MSPLGALLRPFAWRLGSLAVIRTALAAVPSGDVCSDLLSLPREAVGGAESGVCEAGQAGGCSACRIVVPEVAWLAVDPSARGDPRFERHHRVLTAPLTRWMDLALDFVKGRARLTPAFRELWEEITAREAVLASDCSEAPVLARLLWAMLWTVAAQWVGATWAQSAEQLAESQLQQHSGSSVRTAVAEEAYRSLRALPGAELRAWVGALAADHGGGLWRHPLRVPVGSSRRHVDMVQQRRWASAGRGAAADGLYKRAFLELHAELVKRAGEAWPAKWTLHGLLRHGRVQGFPAGGEEQGHIADSGIDFYVGIASEAQWAQLVHGLTAAVLALGWEGCYLTEQAEKIAAGWPAGELECALLGAADVRLPVRVRRYQILASGQRVLSELPFAADDDIRPFSSWGGFLPAELLLPWGTCKAWGHDVQCPGQSSELLKGWNAGELHRSGCWDVLMSPINQSPLFQMPKTCAACELARAIGTACVNATRPVLSGDEHLLALWLSRQAADREGNSLCFSQRRLARGLTHAACCGPSPPDGCWDTTLRAEACCRPHHHQCAALRLVSCDWDVPEVSAFLTSEVLVSQEHGSRWRCLSDDLYREYFEDVRTHISGKNRLHDGILGTTAEKVVAGHLEHADLDGTCPELAALGHMVVLERMCEVFLLQPLSPDALKTQSFIRKKVDTLFAPILQGADAGDFTEVPGHIWVLMRHGACGKVVEASHEVVPAGELVQQPDYHWPSPKIAGQPLESHGLPCSLGPAFKVGYSVHGAEEYDDTRAFVDLANPMPTDGRLVHFGFAALALPGAVVEVMVLRMEHHVSGPVFVKKSAMMVDLHPEGRTTDNSVASELLVWRGDFLCFVVHSARINFRMRCSDCLVAEVPVTLTSTFLHIGSEREGVVELGKRHHRAYAWTAMLQPMRCTPASWHPAGVLPSRLGPPPTASRASCSPSSWAGDRVCSLEDVCFDLASGTFGFHGEAPGDMTVGLSTFVDGRSMWTPSVRPAPREKEVAWIDLPSYLAVRRAPQNWGHYAVETILGLYGLIMAKEDLLTPHGQRLVFFLDDCSLLLRGDAIEYCMRYDPDPLSCLKDIPSLCAKFSRQLWPLISDWAPAEATHLASRLSHGAAHVCFRSVRAGIAPWRRPLQLNIATPGVVSWAADPLAAPVVRLLRTHAAARLAVPAELPGARRLAAAVKTGRRSVRNRPELLQWLREAASERRLHFQELDFETTLREQAAFLASVDLLVASAGSSQFSGLFLPAGRGVLVMPMCVSAGAGRVDCHAEQLLAGCGLKWEQYPVEWDDVSYTIGRGLSFAVRRDVLDRAVHRLLGKAADGESRDGPTNLSGDRGGLEPAREAFR